MRKRRKMNKYLRVAIEVVIDIMQTIGMWFLNNLRNFASIVNIMLPYLCLFIGQTCYQERNKFALGGEIFVPLMGFFVVWYLRSYANKVGKGTTIPRPVERFTEISSDGEVSIPQDRVEELILYMADLEDWMERRKLL